MKKLLPLLISGLILSSILNAQTVTDIDGNIYPIVKLGSQWWMAKNLQTSKYADGTAIAEGTSAGNLEFTPTKQFYFSYNNSTSNATTYGFLYTWAAAMHGDSATTKMPSGVQGACPTGWHLPSDAEWFAAITSLGGDNSAGGKMKEAGSTHWPTTNTNANNISGMTVLPAGLRNYSGLYAELGTHTYFWSTTEVSSDTAKVLSRHFEGLYPSAYNYQNGKPYGLSVRCVMDGSVSIKSSFTPNQTVGSVPFNVNFTNSSQGNIDTYFWDFGDGTFSNAANPSHTYTKDGVYNVYLTVEDQVTKEQVTSTNTITVGQNMVNANFNYTTNNNTISLSYNPSVGTMQCMWQLGNAQISQLPTPSYTYPANGYYIVSLNTLNETTGQISQQEKVVTIGDTTKDCEALFDYTINLTNNTVNFTDASRGTDLSNYLWDFGDGDTAVTKNIQHTFTNNNLYTVCLTASNATCKNISCKDVQIGSATTVNYAKFMYVTDNASNKVYFYNRSNNAKTWSWNFGDGQTSTSEHPQHVYANTGIYEVLLTTTDLQSNSHYYNLLVTVHSTTSILQTSFISIANGKVVNKGVLPIEFKGTNYGDASEVEWDFGDNTTTSSSMSPIHNYDNPGTYYVCMKVYDNVTLQSDTYCDSVKVIATEISNVLQHNDEFVMYPNPAKQSLVVSIKSLVNTNTEDRITITNTLGQIVFTYYFQLATNYSIDISNLESGVYFVRVENTVKKLIINN